MTIQHFEPSGLGEALRAAILRKLLQTLIKPVFSPRFSIRFQRRWLERMSAVSRVPKGVSFEAAQVAGQPGLWCRPAVQRGAGVLLYLHGGAYCIGSTNTHRSLTARLAKVSGLAVFSLEYPLAPEHPMPAAVGCAVAVFQALAAQGPVFIGGDSAGGGLALSCALALRDAAGVQTPTQTQAHPQPQALYLISPWVDMALDESTVVVPPGEAMLSVAWAKACGAHYLGHESAAHPWASPLHANLKGLPPVLIQAGTDELLHTQALQLHGALEAAGVNVRCEVNVGRWHVFQMQADLLSTAARAIERAAQFFADQAPRITASK
jgi:acetyl esterase/lipase